MLVLSSIAGLHITHGAKTRRKGKKSDGRREASEGIVKDPAQETPHKGFALGLTGEYFRYKHMYYKKPSEDDRDEALRLALGLRCDVCTVVVGSLMGKAKGLTEDDLADVLEGNADYELTGEPVTDRMLEHKKGCNKHFKDELIAEGYVLRTCKEVAPGRTDTEPCLHREDRKPSASATDTYEMWKEVLFHACEMTVSRNSDSLASSLESYVQREGNWSKAARAACENEGRCAAPPGRRSRKEL